MDNTKFGEKENQKRLSAYGYLLITAILWGSGFIPQKIGADNLSPFAFNGLRYLLAGITIFCFARFRLPFNGKGRGVTLIAGCVLFIAAALQQVGMKHTTIGNASFITTIYVALVPFLSFILFRQKIRRNSYIAAVFALFGLYLLSTSGKALDKIAFGDAVVFFGSNFWALHIIIVGKASTKVDPIQFSSGQFLICAVLNLLCWGIFTPETTGQLSSNWLPILYSGVLVIGGGFTLQAIAQKHAEESKAAIILGLESVFGAIFGVLFFGESFSQIQIFGAALIFVSVLIAVREDREIKDTILFRLLENFKTLW
ncbi:MAG: DMT family transporter [Flexilinea sp.]